MLDREVGAVTGRPHVLDISDPPVCVDGYEPATVPRQARDRWPSKRREGHHAVDLKRSVARVDSDRLAVRHLTVGRGHDLDVSLREQAFRFETSLAAERRRGLLSGVSTVTRICTSMSQARSELIKAISYAGRGQVPELERPLPGA